MESSSRSNWAQEFIRDFDDDDDGALTRSELPRRRRNQFDRRDPNGDDRLTRQERQQQSRTSAQRRPVAPSEFI
jgi:hypothetical protein